MTDPRQTVRVLHVDDQPDFADLAATYLEREDDQLTVETVTSAEAGLDRLAETAVDCVVSDYEMPGRNGIEFLEAVREDHPDLPFVLYTGKGSEEVASEAISAGVTDYLQKESGTGQYAVLANRIRNAVDQYRARRAVTASRRRLSLFFEQSPLGVIEWDESFRVKRLNDAAREILGYDGDELVGESWERLVPGSDREQVGEVVSDLLEAEGGYHSVNENLRRDGSRIVCEWHNRVVTDDDGDVVSIFSQFQDVTERDERERELERYEAYLEESTDMVTVLAEDGTVQYQSPAVSRILGYDRREMVGEDAFDYVHPDDVDDTRSRFADLASRPGATITVECRFRTVDDDWRWLEVQGTNKLGEEPIDGIVANTRDITERKERERELERQERRYRAIFDDPNILVGLVDTDGTVRDVNRTAMEYVDASLEEVIGVPFSETPWFDHSEAVRADVREWIDRAAGGEYVEFDLDLERPDGEPYAVEGVFRPVVDDDGEVVSLVVSDREVTDRTERERELERIRDFFTEAERLGSLGAWEFDESGDAIWTDGTRRIHGVDDSFEPSVEAGIEFFHPADRDRAERAIAAALEDGDSFDVEARLTTAEGDRRWVRTRGASVETDGDRRVVRGYIQDVTDRKTREQELARAKSQLEAAVEAGDVATWEWHVAEDLLVAGPEFAATFGVDPDEAREGVPLERFLAGIHADDRDRVEARIQATLDDCGSYEAEYRVWDADDDLRWVVARGHVECDEDGEPRRFPGALTDITDLKRAERELRRKNERLDEFARIVSHDLQNPLSVAEGRLELARTEDDDSHLADVARAHERMRTLVDDLLTLAREGESADDRSPVELRDVARRCWRTVETGEATLVTDGECTLRADDGRLRQLLENVFANAVEHGGRDVTVRVGTLADGFYVEDDGTGIPEDRRQAVFDAGFSTDEGSTGIGLAIVDRIAEAHGWNVSIVEGSAGGARFEVTDVSVVDG